MNLTEDYELQMFGNEYFSRYSRIEDSYAYNSDEDEFIETVRIPLDELVDMVMRGEVPDAKTQVAALRAQKLLSERKSL